MKAPVVIEHCRTRWRDVDGWDRAWHTCTEPNNDHRHPHFCACGASCPVLGLAPKGGAS